MADDDNDFADTLSIAENSGVRRLAVAIESAFGVKPLDVPNWTTVGDIYRFVLETPSPEDQPRKCASAMALYALRRSAGLDRKFAPDAPLTAVFAGAPKQELRRLASETGLAMPSSRAGAGVLAGFGCAAAAVAALIAGLGLIVALPFGVLAAVLIGSDRGKYPVETLGQLAEQVAGLNFNHFVAKGADGRAQTIWKALTEVIVMAAEASVDGPRRITPQTRLFR